MIEQLFSFRGRSSRLRYWRIELLCVALIAAVTCAGYFAILSIGPMGGAIFVGMVPIVVMSLAATLRRLHDRGKDLRRMLLFQGVLFLCRGLAHEMVASGTMVAQAASAPLSLVSIGVGIWSFVEIGCLRGQPEPNRFGEAPAPGR